MRWRSPLFRVVGYGLALVSLAGCGGSQSALSGAGTEAAEIGRLFWAMLAGGAAIWGFVMYAAIWAVLRGPHKNSRRDANRLIIVGGVIFPTVVLAALLIFGLGLLEFRTQTPEALKVRVVGEQWWWRVTYEVPGSGREMVTANEIHLPAGQPVEFLLTADKVIHSFWIPPIGGKMDMIPGRENRLVLTAEEPGEYRGVCAEFCGTSHALMAFSVVVSPPAEFDAWLQAQARPAVEVPAAAERGAGLFQAVGCGGCHLVRGIVEKGNVGPDLTHVGGRRTLAAGIAEMDVETLVRWIRDPQKIKAAAEMPAYDMLPEEDIRDIALFLSELK